LHEPVYRRLLKLFGSIIPAIFVQYRDHVIAQVVHHMNGAAADIQNDIVSVVFILMNQGNTPSYYYPLPKILCDTTTESLASQTLEAVMLFGSTFFVFLMRPLLVLFAGLI